MSKDAKSRGVDGERLGMEQDSQLGLAPEIARRRREGALRALAEAEARRQAQGHPPPRAVELGGRPGPEPTRFGDWELNGIATDF